ncbi:MAG: acetyl-CoA carboxylase carboxyltransferase subunit alpha [Candidatus Halichondribacter symbioticus]
MQNYLEFEKPVAEIELKIAELRAIADSPDADMNLEKEVKTLGQKAQTLLEKLYADLTPWRKCQVARHGNRPHFVDYTRALFTDYLPLRGDRAFGDDNAILGGLARFEGAPVVLIGHEKGADTAARLHHNFGMARPEGYRKAIRLMDMAARFGLPVITLVDTPGAYPGRGAEERGQAEAIARCTEKCLQIEVPLVSVIIGEGGSGGAVALATGDQLLMLEHSIYSVISPEGCASILWKNADKMREAAESLRLTAQDLRKLGVADMIVPEPIGGAQRNHNQMFENLRPVLQKVLAELATKSGKILVKNRRDKFLNMGTKGL